MVPETFNFALSRRLDTYRHRCDPPQPTAWVAGNALVLSGDDASAAADAAVRVVPLAPTALPIRRRTCPHQRPSELQAPRVRCVRSNVAIPERGGAERGGLPAVGRLPSSTRAEPVSTRRRRARSSEPGARAESATPTLLDLGEHHAFTVMPRVNVHRRADLVRLRVEQRLCESECSAPDEQGKLGGRPESRYSQAPLNPIVPTSPNIARRRLRPTDGHAADTPPARCAGARCGRPS